MATVSIHVRDLSNAQSEILNTIPEPTPRRDRRGRPWKDRRAVLNGILWVLRTGAPWADVPDHYPSYQTWPSPIPTMEISVDVSTRHCTPIELLQRTRIRTIHLLYSSFLSYWRRRLHIGHAPIPFRLFKRLFLAKFCLDWVGLRLYLYRSTLKCCQFLTYLIQPNIVIIAVEWVASTGGNGQWLR